MTGDNVDLVKMLLQYGLTPLIVIIMLLRGDFVTRREYDRTIRWGDQMFSLWQESAAAERSNLELLKEMVAAQKELNAEFRSFLGDRR